MSIYSNYKQKNILSPGLSSLYTSRAIVLIASGFLGLFLPVFLLIQYKDLKTTILFYLISWFLYLMLVAPGAKLMNVFGLKRVFIASLPFLALFYGSLYFFEKDIWLFTILAIVTLTFYRMCYWVPYHTEMAKLSEKKNRGKQMSLLSSFSSFFGIIIPVVSGFLITQFGFQPVFIIVIILVLTAMIPLNFLPQLNEKFSWSYGRTWSEFFSGKNRKMMIAYMADGAENWIGGVLWPIFIWQLLEGKYLTVGIVTSAITLVAVVFKLIMGDYTDKFSKRKLMRAGSVLYSAGWIVKMFITTAFQIFLASTYHNFALIILRTPFDALVYEKAADSGHYVDEYSTLREMYHQTGRITVIVAVLILLNYLPLNLTFFLAAMASLLVNLLPKQGLYEKTGIR
ncbi:MFS transporter [Patescibacteria group bacterium]|nr:MFS transporter [Patescibacteria group bacterium]